jgi:hypothetical protein
MCCFRELSRSPVMVFIKNSHVVHMTRLAHTHDDDSSGDPPFIHRIDVQWKHSKVEISLIKEDLEGKLEMCPYRKQLFNLDNVIRKVGVTRSFQAGYY